jgi:hypothetical protein
MLNPVTIKRMAAKRHMPTRLGTRKTAENSKNQRNYYWSITN